ncbi:MAG: LacI family transcriptional regulator [Leeuwenhoekiella sp.]|nr:LacI family transcriptional regulator [Leeuwenhoekiella sp.]
MEQTTLRDIAEKLNISITTVSKALKGYKDVSPKTRKKVLEIAESLNYKPNSFAVNLRTKESRIIGVIIPDVVHHFFSTVVNGIIELAEKKGYLVIVLQSNESYELEKKQIDLLIDKRVDGIIISLANKTDDFKHLLEVIDRKIPLVMFDKIAKVVPCSKVVIDDRKAAYIATSHLLKNGCKRIAHFRGTLIPQNAIDRFLGYKQALKDYNIPYDPSIVYECPAVDFEDGIRNAEKLLQDHTDIDGLFTGADQVAVGAIKVFNEKGIKMPQDIALIGFSNWFVSSAITPTLSTVDQPGFKMGKKAFKLLLKELNAGKQKTAIKHKTVVLPTALITRDSTNNTII